MFTCTAPDTRPGAVRVVSRSSSFYMNGKSDDVPEPDGERGSSTVWALRE
jgi:hypothetical protein